MSIREREASALAVKEKETGIIEQLMMTPAQTAEMLLAKTSPVFVLMMVVLFVALITGVVVFGLPVRGALWLFTLPRGLCGAGGDRYRRDAGNRFEIAAAGAVTDLLRESPNYPAFGLSVADREHAGFLSETLVSGPIALSGHDHSRCDIEGRTMERIVAQFGRPGDLCNYPVCYQRMALPKAVRRL